MTRFADMLLSFLDLFCPQRDLMAGFWLSKFSELAEFNSDKDKTKYNKRYLEKMKVLQEEYDMRLAEFEGVIK